MLHEAGIEPSTVLEHPDILPVKGRTGDKLRRGIDELSATDLSSVRARAEVSIGASSVDWRFYPDARRS